MKMNKYLETREVLATPMTRGEYNDYRMFPVTSSEDVFDQNEPGYLVENINNGIPMDSRHAGFIHWMPADVFHRAHSPIDTWLDRVKQEQAELQVKLDALDKTLNVERNPDFITDQQWSFMTRQQFHMRQYNQILKDRIANAV